MYLFLLFIVAWIACGIVACGFYFASGQRPYSLNCRVLFFEEDQQDSIFCIFLGLVSLVVVLICKNTQDGWLWPWSAKAREEAGIN